MSTTVKAIESLLVKARRALRTAAAAVVFGITYLCRRPTRSAPSAAGLVALSLGLTVFALHPASPSFAQPSRLGHAKIEAQVITHQPVTKIHNATSSATHVRKSMMHHSASVPRMGKPPGRSLHAKVGPSDTKVKTKQYGPVLNPVPDAVDCVHGGVIVSTSYIGCRISPGRN
jgi:hypothetical protein